MKNKVMRVLMGTAKLLLFGFLFGTCYASTTAGSTAYSQYIEDSLNSFANIVQYVSIALGVGMGVSGMFLLKKYGQMRTMMSQQLTLTKPLLMLIAASALLILPTFIATAEQAFWGDDWYSTTMSLDVGEDWTGLVKPVFMLIRLMGVVALIRGILMSTRASGQQAQPGMAGKAGIHFIAGILCVNIDGTARILGNIFDFSSIF